MNASVIKAKDLSYGTPEGRILQRSLHFDVAPGQALLISGSNGCGKSTLLKILLGESQAAGGTVTCPVERRRIEYLPQLENTEVHLPLTLRDVIVMSHGRQVPFESLAAFGLLRPEHLDMAWNSASGGERKRTLLTRALLRDPKLLVLDEPMNHLDEESRRAVARSLAAFLRRTTPSAPRAVIMVCHQGLPEEEGALFSLVPLPLERLTTKGTDA